MTMLGRHDLVWLSHAGWEAVCMGTPEIQEAQLAVIDRWSAAGWPATVRRQDPQAAPDQVCLGITPPHDGKGESGARIRVALRCPRAEIAKATRPLALDAASVAVPAQWQTAYRKLIDDTAGLEMRVYGSLALQALTGRPYLTERSDIDLAFYPSEAAELAAGIAILDAARNALPLDGEIVFPSGRGVAWKEWSKLAAQGSNARVLAKDIDTVGLIPVAELLHEFTVSPCRP